MEESRLYMGWADALGLRKTPAGAAALQFTEEMRRIITQAGATPEYAEELKRRVLDLGSLSTTEGDVTMWRKRMDELPGGSIEVTFDGIQQPEDLNDVPILELTFHSDGTPATLVWGGRTFQVGEEL